MAEFEHFKDRKDAGAQLARQLQQYAHNGNVIVLALPRGGVPVGCAIATALETRLDVLLVRKLGVPGQDEYAMGAIAGGGLRLLHKDVVDQLHIAPAAVQQVIDREQSELARREALYRPHRKLLDLKGRIVIIADDGLATGATMRVAVEVVRAHKPARIVVAVPVGSIDARDAIAAEVDEMVCLLAPPLFHAVSQWYTRFDQLSDEQVTQLLAAARHPDYAGLEREAELATQFTR